eukprot:15448550-Alexandrium_andersonii.AAC.1
METTWWHFSKAWKSEVVQGRARALSFSRSRHLSDFAKVVAFLSTGSGQERERERRMNAFLDQEADCTAMDYEAAIALAEE